MSKVDSYIFEETKEGQFEEGGSMPLNPESGKVYFCQAHGISVHLCPCGCGDKVFLPFKEFSGSHPHLWQLHGNSFSPSIQKTGGCKSHYFIKNGRVQWA